MRPSAGPALVAAVWLLIAAAASLRSEASNNECDRRCWNVQVYHVINNALWGETDGSGLQGLFPCFQHLSSKSSCELITSPSASEWLPFLEEQRKERSRRKETAESGRRCCAVSVGLYNIHSWGSISKWPHSPARDRLATRLTMAESEESTMRFHRLFSASFPHFDGNSTTSPRSTIQRYYFRKWNASEILSSRKADLLIPGAAFVASTCHRGDSLTKRIAFVRQLQQHMRVDSLGKCIQTKVIPEGVTLGTGSTEQESLQLKRAAIGRYMFYLAFENTFEPGYVTEKVFDALIAGVVPVYLGAEDCRKLLPHPKAAIFVSDFGGDPARLAQYLTYLMKNHSAYDEHRQWRVGYNFSVPLPWQSKTWPCRICEWAVEKMRA